MPTIYIKDYDTEVEIPEGSDMAQVQAALKKQFPPKGETQSTNTPAPAPQTEVPEWGRKNPNLYGVVGATRETLGPIAEAIGMGAGGIAGTAAAGPVGGLAGAGLGYAGAKQGVNYLDELLGNKAPATLPQAAGQAALDIPTGAAMEAGGQVAGKAIGAGLKFAGKGINQVLGATTGSGPGATEAALKGTPAFKQAMRGNTTGDEIVDNVRGALQTIKDKRAAAYISDLQGVSANKQDLDISPIRNKASELMQRYNVKLDAKGNLDFSRIAMGKAGRNDIEEIANTISSWGNKPGDKTATGLDVLKRQLDDFYSDSSQARQFVSSLRDTVKGTIVRNVPQYANMTRGYAEATNLIKDIESGLMLRKQGMTGRVTGDMTLRRLTSAMKENFPLRKELLETLGAQSGADVADQVAGHAMSQIVPRGLFGKLSAMGAGYAGYLGYISPKLWPLLAASSPRAVGEFLNVYGKALSGAKNAAPTTYKTLAFGTGKLMEENK